MTPLAVLEATGRPVVRGLDWLLASLGLAVRALAALPELLRRGPARAEFQRTLRLALPGSLAGVLVAALLVGLTLIGWGLYWLTFVGQAGLVRTMMVDLLVREVVPMLVALVLLARVGTRNLVELAALRAGPAWRGLAGEGIDPFRLLAASRAFACGIAGFVHCVLAVIVTALGAHLTALALGASTLRPAFFLASILDGMRFQDFVLLALKGPALGFTVGLATCAAALTSAKFAATPERLLPRGLGLSVLAAMAVSLVLSLLL
jgi:phospholipid/cholesterol/gamma-HCH transport system permease protein